MDGVCYCIHTVNKKCLVNVNMMPLIMDNEFENPNIRPVNRTHFATVVAPCVMALELENGRYYIAITRNVNEFIAKLRVCQGPMWVRNNPLRRVVELECDGNGHSLTNMTINYIHKYGHDNVRSSLNSSLTQPEAPKFYTEFLNMFKLDPQEPRTQN